MSDAEKAGQEPMTEEQIQEGITQAMNELVIGEGDTDAVLDRMLELQIAGRAIGMTFESDKKEEPTAEQVPAEPAPAGKVWTFTPAKSTDYSAGRKW